MRRVRTFRHAAPREVAIAGCGVAGAALACLLGRHGVRVQCFERDAARPRRGAGLLLSPAGQQVLAQLGLLDAAQALGAPVQRIRSEGRGERPLFELHYGEWRRGAQGLGL